MSPQVQSHLKNQRPQPKLKFTRTIPQ